MILETSEKAGFSEEFLLEQYKTDTKLPVAFLHLYAELQGY